MLSEATRDSLERNRVSAWADDDSLRFSDKRPFALCRIPLHLPCPKPKESLIYVG